MGYGTGGVGALGGGGRLHDSVVTGLNDTHM